MFFTWISTENNTTKSALVQIAVYLEFDVCFIGYFILMALGWYWFRKKYCDNREVANKVVILAWMFVMQCTFATINFFLIKFIKEGTPYYKLSFQYMLDVSTFFIFVLPSWYIIRTHRKAFEKEKESDA